jgi:hypothetical protein
MASSTMDLDRSRKMFQDMLVKPGSHYWHSSRSPQPFIVGRPARSAHGHGPSNSNVKNPRASIAKLSAILNLSPRNAQLVDDRKQRTDLIGKCMKLRVERDAVHRVVALLKLKLAACRLQTGHSYQKWLSAPLTQKNGFARIEGNEINDTADDSDGPLCSKCLETWKHVASVPALLSSMTSFCPVYWFDGTQSTGHSGAPDVDVEVCLLYHSPPVSLTTHQSKPTPPRPTHHTAFIIPASLYPFRYFLHH